MADAFVQIEGLRELQRDLRRYAPDVRRDMQLEFKGLANSIAQEAKANASWSSRIPSAIGSVANLRRGVAIRVRRTPRVPHGPLYERGSRRNRGVVRHPVFGNRDVWVSTPTRPFLKPAVDRNRPRALEESRRILSQAARRVGI